MENLLHNITLWLKNQLVANNKSGYYLGISGGVDSCVLTQILHQSNIPYQSIHYLFEENGQTEYNEVIRFLMLKKELNIKIKNLYLSLTACINDIYEEEVSTLNYNAFLAILKSKLSHIDLSQKARSHNYLVLGTINLDEFLLGYFVKNTSIGDILPFANIPKKTIRSLGRDLGLSENIINLKASGCIYGNTAEEEWEISENDLYYLVTNQFHKVDQDIIEIYKKMVTLGAHKRIYAPIFVYNERIY